MSIIAVSRVRTATDDGTGGAKASQGARNHSFFMRPESAAAAFLAVRKRHELEEDDDDELDDDFEQEEAVHQANIKLRTNANIL